MGIFFCRDLLIYSTIALLLHSQKSSTDISILLPIKPSHGKGPVNYEVKTYLPFSSLKFPPLSVDTTLLTIITCLE
jgi:hypothetical protein